MNFIEEYRQLIMKDLLSINSFTNPWSIWKGEIIKQVTVANPTYKELIAIGENLRDIVFTTNKGRAGDGTVSSGQGTVSSIGTAWECILTWYLNFGLVGSRTVVFKAKDKFMPTPIKRALTLKIGNYSSSTETDIIAITFPHFIKDKIFSKEELNKVIEDCFEEIKINVIQCKTNWNDNSQIPMAWDIIYSTGGIKHRNITIGDDEYSLQKLTEFKYSFMTLPTQKDLEKKYKKSSIAVLRVRGLSGYNFWGNPTKDDVAYSIGECFTMNFSGSFEVSQFEKNALASLQKYLLAFDKTI